LLAAVQDIIAGITDPVTYRNLTVTGNQAGVAGDVVITGTDWDGNVITETITAVDNTTVVGDKPFKTVTSISLPVLVGAGDEIAVGIGVKLGLALAPAADAAIINLGRKAAADAAFTLETPAAVSAANKTVTPAGSTIVADDQFEIYYTANL
jgi:hypothetical protein